MNMETDNNISEYCESEEFCEAKEFGPVAGEIYEYGTELNELAAPTEQTVKPRRLSGLLRRMGYLVAAALSVVVISQSATGEYASSSISYPVRDRMVDYTMYGYEGIGNAYGGVIPVRKGDMWGAVDYDFKEIVPCIYLQYGNITEKGLSCFEKDNTVYIYDKHGKLLANTSANSSLGFLEGSVSSDFYGFDNWKDYVKYREYYNKEGVLVSSELISSNASDFTAFYDGKMLLTRMTEYGTEYGVMDEKGNVTWKTGNNSNNIQSSGSSVPSKPKKKNIFQKIWHFLLYFEFEDEPDEVDSYEYPSSGNSGGMYYDENGCYEDFGDESGNSNVLTFNSEQELMEYMGVDPTIFDFDQFIMDQMAEDDFGCGDYYDYTDEFSCGDDYYNSDEYVSGGSVNEIDTLEVLNSFQHGYATLVHDRLMLEVRGALMDEEYNLAYRFDLANCFPDDKKGFVVVPDYQTNDRYDIRSYYYNGGYFRNYGSKMVWRIGNKDVLVDLSKQTGMTTDNRIVQAVHDGISFSNEKYWLFMDTIKVSSADSQQNQISLMGYMNHDGKVIKGYDRATEFAKGQALVVENNNTYMIDENFKKIKSFGETQNIGRLGDLLYIFQNGKQYIVNL